VQQQIWGEVLDFNLTFFQFIWKCNSENFIKIGPYLPKLLQEKFGAVFFGPPCMCGVSLYDNFGITSKSSEDMATEGIEKSQFAITPRSVDAS